MRKKNRPSKSPSVRVLVPATSGNLGPGFDSMGMALDLFNSFEGRPAASSSLEIEGDAARDLPASGRRVLFDAIDAAYRHRRRKTPDFHIRAISRLPVARGLGSSATAIVGGLLLASAWLKKGLTRQEVLDLAARIEGHPDNVAPALLGGVTACAMDGSSVDWVRIPFPSGLHALALIPSTPLSTKKARGLLPRTIPVDTGVFNLSRTALLMGRLASGTWRDGLWTAVDDRFHQPYRAALMPGFEQVLAAARRKGAAAAFLSGAGPTIMVWCRSRDQALARHLVGVFAKVGVEVSPRWLRTCRTGARICWEEDEVRGATATVFSRPS